MKKNQHKHKRILISVPLLTFHHRLGLLGILKYVQEHKANSWEIFIESELVAEQGILDINQWKYDGIIAYVANDKIRKWLMSAQIPVVLYEPSIPFKENLRMVGKSKIVSTRNYIEEGRIAAKYFIERRYQHFAYVGLFNEMAFYDKHRRCGFANEVIKSGFTCHVYSDSIRNSTNNALCDRSNLIEWLSHLPVRTGVFVVSDVRAIDVLAAAKHGDILIPEHIAVLGFDNDELICNTASPQLSSIYVDVPYIGYENARLLDTLLACDEDINLTISKPDIKVVTRTSTAVEAICDPFVSKAVTWIRNNITNNPGIETVAKAINYPLKLLQRKFKTELGCSIGNEIIRQKTTRAINELISTNKGTTQIAYECGFSNASHLCLHIKKLTGKTPRQIRSCHD